jgi:hypothetical protein
MQKLLGAVMSLSLAAFAAAPAAAQDARPPGNNDSIQAAVVLGNKKATKVTVEQNAPLQTLSPFVYHPLDAPKVLNCGTTTCEIEAEITTQLQRSTAVATSVAFRFVIDGNAVDGAGYWAGLLAGFFLYTLEPPITT